MKYHRIWKLQYKDNSNGMYHIVYVDCLSPAVGMDLIKNQYTEEPDFTLMEYEQINLIKQNQFLNN